MASDNVSYSLNSASPAGSSCQISSSGGQSAFCSLGSEGGLPNAGSGGGEQGPGGYLGGMPLVWVGKQVPCPSTAPPGR